MGKPLEPMAEIVYMPKGSTKNLPVVAIGLSDELFEHMAERIKLYEHMHRKLGRTEDPTRYYTFEGENYFLRNGLVQLGRAVTTDNMEGFRMIRLFANSTEGIRNLESEVGLFDKVPAVA